MIDRKQLLADLKPLLKEMEADLRARCDDVPKINEDLKTEYDQARAADRTGITFEEWRADLITQVAVAWVLSCVFVRFLEDNGLISPPKISGPVGGGSDQQSAVSRQQAAISDQQGKRDDSRPLTAESLSRARDERETYFKTHARETDRDYLLAVFDDLSKLKGGGAKDIFGPHNPVGAYRNWLSGDAAQKLIEFFQKIDTDGMGEIIHDFTDPTWDTRFLGDLYQDLSEAARKKYALLQTPIFVEEFILERTLEPAINEFGLDGSGQRSAVSGQPDNKADSRLLNAECFRMIDPACGSGHFLLGSFARILKHWRAKEPGVSDRELVNRALASVHGVDLNPYAVAIARFRLLVAAMRECQILRLRDAPAFAFNLVCGDSLLHGAPGTEQHLLGFHELAHVYRSEDLSELRHVLKPGTYHAVVANPPYITVKDKALNQAYRERYPEVCHRKYSLSVPFLQRLFVLARDGGYTGQITANSFMKREFGKKLVEKYLPKIDLTHVIDTAGAYIPGHGTPTVILFGRNRRPVAPIIRAVMGIKGEPATPADPAQGRVWTAITRQIDQMGSQSAFISVNDTPREQFGKHPWSIGGGGAAELKELLDEQSETVMQDVVAVIGIFGMTNADEVMLAPDRAFARFRVERNLHCPLVIGDQVRDWIVEPVDHSLFPYQTEQLLSIEEHVGFHNWVWPCRTVMGNRATFGKSTYFAEGRPWWEWHQVCLDRLRTPLSIVLGFVATHNHFVLDRGGKVFNRSAPVIKLPANATEADHLAVLGLLNSSTACFWLKQVAHNKGSTVDDKGARQRTAAFEDFYEFTGTQLEGFPLTTPRPVDAARQVDGLARRLLLLRPDAVVRQMVPTVALLAERRKDFDRTLAEMIALQEELDWECYRLYGLIEDAPRSEGPPPIKLGQRAFEIVLARKMAAREEETTWFIRHSSTPVTDIPIDWPESYRKVIQRRIDIIETNRTIALVERPENKRRWNTEPWEEQQERALRSWLLDRLEGFFDLDGRMNDRNEVTARGELREPRLTTVAKVADISRQDKDFMQVAEIFTGRMDFDVGSLVGDLVTAESVPALPVLRYKPATIDKRRAWERTWDLQRLEDAVDAQFDVERLRRLSAVCHNQSDISEKRFAISSQLLAESSSPNADRSTTLNTDHLAVVLPEIFVAMDYVVEAINGNLNLNAEAILRPIQDAAKRAKNLVVGQIPIPPRYASADFLSNDFWRLRGKLDVPKERWVSFPHCEGEDGTLVIAWAGYDHLQMARAIAERYELAKEQEGRKLVPLLAAIGQLIPWLKQWHNELDPTYGTRMGDYFEKYLAEEAKALDMTVKQVMAWTPPEKAKKASRKKKG